MKILALIPIALALAGCSSTNITKLMEAAGHDSASTVVNVTTLYGQGRYSRLGPGAIGMVGADGTLSITGVSSNFTWPPELRDTPVGGTVVSPNKSVFKRIQ